MSMFHAFMSCTPPIHPYPPLPHPPLTQFNHNQLEDWRDIDQLKGARNLQTVYFEGNPVAKDTQYRRKLKLTLPTLTQIDATMC